MRYVEFQMIALNPICLVVIKNVSKNGCNSGLAAINCGVYQGSVVRSLIFLLYLNDLN